jgi:hypothetical protein
MIDFFPTSTAQQVTWLTNFKNKIAIHGETLGLSKEEVATHQENCTKMIDKINFVETQKTALKAAVKSKEETQRKEIGNLRAAIARFKTATLFDKSIGQDLSVMGTNLSMDKKVYRPKITAEIYAGFVRLKFIKKGTDGVNIYHRKKGESTWKFLARDTKSPYDDKIVLATEGQPEHWEYRAYGVIKDTEIGQPSDIVEIVYGG